jgi:hypothetical protein
MDDHKLVVTRNVARDPSWVNFFFIKNIKKKLKFKSVRSLYKVIPKSIGSVC